MQTPYCGPQGCTWSGLYPPLQLHFMPLFPVSLSPATKALMLYPEHAKYIPASEFLHWLFLLPGTFFSQIFLSNKNKSKQMGPNQTYKHSKGKHKQNEKSYRMGENICKRCDQQGLNFQNIQTAHTTQQQKSQTTQSKNGHLT